jgi:hypothetical protein
MVKIPIRTIEEVNRVKHGVIRPSTKGISYSRVWIQGERRHPYRPLMSNHARRAAVGMEAHTEGSRGRRGGGWGRSGRRRGEGAVPQQRCFRAVRQQFGAIAVGKQVRHYSGVGVGYGHATGSLGVVPIKSLHSGSPTSSLRTHTFLYLPCN